MKYQLLSNSEMKTIDSLKEYHGGAKEIVKTIDKMRNYEVRKRILGEKGFGEMIEDAEKLVKKFAKSRILRKRIIYLTMIILGLQLHRFPDGREQKLPTMQ